jgi:aryl-alcohol dehydrogenase-like predicted oxidoreductase
MTQPIIPKRRIGVSDLEVGVVGVGTWQWGDLAYWGGRNQSEPTDVSAAYAASMSRGANLLDTAEIYGSGKSERRIGELRAGDARPAVVATKYFPVPTRWQLREVDAAIDGSLNRLGAECIDLYQVHWPMSVISHRRLLRRLAGAVHDGRIRYIGVSNFTARQMYRAHAVLAHEGVSLVSNQVSYSLLRRAPEVNGVLEACHDLGVTLIAYSPVGQGILTGKYGPAAQLPRKRRLARLVGGPTLERAMPVIETLRRIGSAMGITASQAAIAWTRRDSVVLPIVGERTAAQAKSNADAAEVTLDQEAIRELDSVSSAYCTAGRIARRFMG